MVDAIALEVVAERQGQVAASNMLGADRPFQMVPFFWTKHFDLSIRYVGHAKQWDDLIVEGDLSVETVSSAFAERGVNSPLPLSVATTSPSALSWQWSVN